MAKWLPTRQIAKLFEIVRMNGGIRGSLWKLFIMDALKDGKFVGEDKYGNKYFENPRYFFGRNRWVEYAPHVFLDYDATQIPAEWFGWLHYRTDYLPHEDPGRPNYPWMQPHTELFSDKSKAFIPYSTPRSKIHIWKPPNPSNCPNK